MIRARVHHVVAVIDVGLPVNPLSLQAQTESGIIDGPGAALFGEITIERGRPVQSTFEHFPLLGNLKSEAEGDEVRARFRREAAAPANSTRGQQGQGG